MPDSVISEWNSGDVGRKKFVKREFQISSRLRAGKQVSGNVKGWKYAGPRPPLSPFFDPSRFRNDRETFEFWNSNTGLDFNRARTISNYFVWSRHVKVNCRNVSLSLIKFFQALERRGKLSKVCVAWNQFYEALEARSHWNSIRKNREKTEKWTNFFWYVHSFVISR